MRLIIDYRKVWHILMNVLVGSSILMAFSCKDNDKETKWVDLRYAAQDEYSITATSPEPIVIQVKSTAPWEVYSQHDGWCSIEPETGDDVDRIYDVTIRYTDNNELDDRTDTITVKSDYWIGKWITVKQKGTAFLNLEGHEGRILPKEGGSFAFKVLSNQDWTAAVTDGHGWLSVTAGASGSINGEIVVAAIPNEGAKRYGTVTVYDRNGKECATVACTQDGIQLDPATELIHAEYKAYQYRLDVTSNTEWIVTKDDADIDWYSFDQTTFNGSVILLINLQENESTSIRQASFTIATKAVEGEESVVKTIVLKQAFNPAPTVYEFDKAEVAKWSPSGTAPVVINGNDVSFTASAGNSRMVRSNFVPGYYEFRLKSMEPTAHSIIFVAYGEKEIRYHMSAANKQTDISTTPWNDLNNVSFDPTQPHSLGINITKGDNGMANFDWMLDGVIIGSVKNFTSFDQPADIFVGANQTGTVVYDWWSYTSLLDWGD